MRNFFRSMFGRKRRVEEVNAIVAPERQPDDPGWLSPEAYVNPEHGLGAITVERAEDDGVLFKISSPSGNMIVGRVELDGVDSIHSYLGRVLAHAKAKAESGR